MAKTEVILLKHIVGVGSESDQVKVAAGYARNYLLPQGLAIPLNAASKRRLEFLRQRRAEREAQELNTTSDLAKSLQKLVLKVKIKTGEDGKLFGAVTSGMIADELKHQFDITIDKRKIQTDHGLKTLGEHEVPLNLHADVKAVLKVLVESLNPPPPPVEVADKKEKAEEARGDRRRPRAPRAEKAAAKPGNA